MFEDVITYGQELKITRVRRKLEREKIRTRAEV